MLNQPRFEGGRASPVGHIGVAGRTISRLLDHCATTISVEVVCPCSFVCPDCRAEGAQRVDAYSSMETGPVSFACLCPEHLSATLGARGFLWCSLMRTVTSGRLEHSRQGRADVFDGVGKNPGVGLSWERHMRGYPGPPAPETRPPGKDSPIVERVRLSHRVLRVAVSSPVWLDCCFSCLPRCSSLLGVEVLRHRR